MKRVLFLMYIDLFKPISEEIYFNSGDTVYYTAGISYFYGIDNAKFYTKKEVLIKLKEDPNWGIKNFDICIMMEACIFFELYNDAMKENAELISMLKIPVFVLGAGIQSDVNYSMNFLESIKDSAKIYLDSIYNSGGLITLRGNFTKEVLETLGYKNVFVSGCPSLFLKGKNLHISNEKASKEEFKPMLNGETVDSISYKIYKDYPESLFFDQGIYFKFIYKPDLIDNVYEYSTLFYKLFKSGRIFGDMNFYPWFKKVNDSCFNFSYGSRVHGNFIAIQNGIPSFVKVNDSRVRELVEFFKIPNSINYNFNEKKDNLYDLYLNINYDEFNKNFIEKFNKFKIFLDNNNIPNILDSNNNKYINYLSNLDYYDPFKDKKIIDSQNILIDKALKNIRYPSFLLKNFYYIIYKLTRNYKYKERYLLCKYSI